MSWSLRFHIPIPLADGRELRTLQDAGEYIHELPRATHEKQEWQVAIETLIAAVEERGPLMFAEIAVRKAVNAGKPDPEPPAHGGEEKSSRQIKPVSGKRATPSTRYYLEPSGEGLIL
jgi:hypothetical protein